VSVEPPEGIDFLRYVRPLFGQDAAQAIAATEGAAGRTPRKRMPRGFDEGRLREVLRLVAMELAALQGAGRRRAIEPGRIRIGRDGRVMLVEVLPAAAAGGGARAAFLAPEQVDGVGVGAAADWYGFGVALYLALAGRLPFTGSTEQVMSQKRHSTPVAPSQLVEGIPADLDALCLGLLRRDPAQRPDAAAVLRALGADAPGAGQARLRVAALAGRSAELARLREALEASRQAPVAVLASGPPGAGATALLRHFLDGLGETVPVLAGRCHPGAPVPYQALEQVMEGLAQHLAALPADEAAALLPEQIARVAEVFPVLQQVGAIAAAIARAPGAPSSDPYERRHLLFDALRALWRRLGQRVPVVVAIDDLHWADADSLALLAHLLHPPKPPPFLLCATVRTDAGAEAVEALRAALGGEARVLPVEPVRDSAAAGPVELDAALAGLAPAPRRLLEILCIAGAPLLPEVCAGAAGLSAGELPAAIETLRAARLIRVDPVRLGHPLEPGDGRVRDAVAAELAVGARRDLHLQLATALAGAGAEPALLAHHFAAGGDPVRAAGHAVAAADRAAAALAFHCAADHYRAALDLASSGSPDSAAAGALDAADARRLRVRLAESLAHADRGGEAGEAFLAAVAAAPADDPEAFALQRRAAEQLLRSGRVDLGLQALEAVLATIGMRLAPTPRRALLSLVGQRLRLGIRGLRFKPRPAAELPAETLRRIDILHCVSYGLGLTDTLRAADFQTRQLILSLRTGEPDRIVRALAHEICYRSATGIPGEAQAQALIEHARNLAAERGNPALQAVIEASAVLTAYTCGRWRNCLELADRTELLLRASTGLLAWELDGVQLFGMRSLFFLGRVAEMRRRLPLLLHEAHQRGDIYLSTNLRIGPMVHAWLAEDDPAEARHQSREAMRGWRNDATHLEHFYELIGEAAIDLYEGDPAAAQRRMAETWPRLERQQYFRIQVTRIVGAHCRGRIELACADQSDSRTAEPHLKAAARAARLLQGERAAHAVPLAGLLLAGIAARRGDDAGAARLLEEAERACIATDLELLAIAARRQRGRLLGGTAGATLIAAADAAMTAEQITRPARFADLLVPGFPDR
jgi:eukaryotic-like serine/threonine-protein kinase